MSYIEDYDETIDSLASEAWWENKRSKTDLDSLVRSAADRYTATFGDAEAVMRFTSNATALWDEGIGLSDEAASSYRGVIRAIAYHALMRDVYDTISVNETPESVIETLRGDGYVKSEEDYNNAYEAARDLKDDGAY